MSKVKGLLARLARALVEMGNVTTDKGVLAWDGEEDLKAGDAVFIEDGEGNRTPAEDGDYTTGDGKAIVVVGGKVSEIKDAEAQVAPQEPEGPQVSAEEKNHIDTDKGTLVYEGDLAVGVSVEIVGEGGNTSPAPDGEYIAPDESVIVVADGKVSEIKPAQEPEPAPQVENKFAKVAQAFQETYNEKMEALVKAIEEMGFSWPWLVEAGDEFVIAEIYNDEGPIYYRFNIKEWSEEGVPVLENGVKVVPAFVTPEEKEAAEENFQAVVREKEALASQVADLSAQVEELKAKPAGSPAHQEFTGSGEQGKTGNKGLDNLSRIARAK